MAKKVYHDGAVSGAKRVIDAALIVLLSALCLVWVYPVILILNNSLKLETAISTTSVFELPTAETFVGLKNYIYGVTQMNFLVSFGYSLVITVSSVALIILCCSMCAWFITRVNILASKLMYLLCAFSMVVPFQMVMFTLSKTADTLQLNTPLNICIIFFAIMSVISCNHWNIKLTAYSHNTVEHFFFFNHSVILHFKIVVISSEGIFIPSGSFLCFREVSCKYFLSHFTEKATRKCNKAVAVFFENFSVNSWLCIKAINPS